jgi:cathepsin B
MRFQIFALLLAGIFCSELLVTKEYTDYLKLHATWEVMDYEENIFRGWTMDDAKVLLGAKQPEYQELLPEFIASTPNPSSLSWKDEKCIHEVRNQGNCGSCWAFGVAGMISDLCCLAGKDEGWLSPQELVSCDKSNWGCSGGWPLTATQYVANNKGLVKDECIPYVARDTKCPTTCQDGSEFNRVCNCQEPEQCLGIENMKGCLAKGPITVTFGVCRSFFNYKNGIYKCDCGASYAGLHAVTAVGFKDQPECHWIVRNSWGTSWGMKGYFHIGCDQCGMDGKYPNGNVRCTIA